MATAGEFENLMPIEKGGRFECPWEQWKHPSSANLLKWKFWEKDNTNLPDKATLEKVLPVCSPDQEKLKNPPKDRIQVTWIGHATVLVQFDGITILADPVFSDVCGPMNQGKTEKWSLFGYKRYRPPSCEIEELPNIDAVIISHDHYDHLDKPSVKKLNEKFQDIHWYVGKGLKAWFTKLQCKNVEELTWWESKQLCVNVSGEEKKFSFIFTPAQHWCRRGLIDENTCLWGSWVVKGPTKSFFFAGDTGYYQPVFEKIGEKYGPFDLAALPIGAYEPRYITKYQHVEPKESVQIHTDIKSEWSIGIHWGSLMMTNEFFVEPPQKLLEELKAARSHETKKLDPTMVERLADERFQCLNHGEVWTVGEPRKEAPFMSHPNPSQTKSGPSQSNM